MRWGSKSWYALLIAIMVLVTADVLLNGPLRHLDGVVHRFNDAYVQGGWFDLVYVCAKFGQRGDLLYIIGPLAGLAALRARSLRYPLMAAAIVIVLSGLQLGLKAAIPRTFPISNTDVLFHGGTAYPSGHTLNGFVLEWMIFELLVVALPALRGPFTPLRRRDLAVVTGFIAGAGLTLTDYHWLTDVLFSLALGLILLDIVIRLRPFTRDVPR